MFGCVVKLNATSYCECSFGFEGFVKRSFGVSAQVVADDNHFFAVCVPAFELL